MVQIINHGKLDGTDKGNTTRLGRRQTQEDIMKTLPVKEENWLRFTKFRV